MAAVELKPRETIFKNVETTTRADAYPAKWASSQGSSKLMKTLGFLSTYTGFGLLAAGLLLAPTVVGPAVAATLAASGVFGMVVGAPLLAIGAARGEITKRAHP